MSRRTVRGPAAVGLHLRLRHLALLILLLGIAAAQLRAFGRPWWCDAGDLRVWSGDVWSRHNSQHLVDPYTVTHAMHGVFLYGLLWLVLRPIVGAVGRFATAVGIEAAWEIIENTNAMIERYRAATISLDYYGDSVINSLGDIVAFVLGYVAMTVTPAAIAVVGFFAVDAILVIWIRDSLLLNVLMLVYPIESLKAWQMGGHFG